MTIVTAMVSPSARPSARITAPKMPARADGSTTRHVVSHHVAPSATAFSFRPRGTARMTSRETALSVGRIITASTSEAVADRRLEVLERPRREHVQGPHAVDDARDRGQQLDPGADHTSDSCLALFSEHDRDGHADRQRDREGDEARRHGAEDRGKGAEG